MQCPVLYLRGVFRFQGIAGIPKNMSKQTNHIFIATKLVVPNNNPISSVPEEIDYVET